MEYYQKGRSASITLMIIGIVIFAMGVIGIGWLGFEETKYIEYGGDAYTGIQNAAADSANNIVKACGIVCAVMGFLAANIGKILLHYFDVKEVQALEEKTRHNEILSALTGKVCHSSLNNDDKPKKEKVWVCSSCRKPIKYGARQCDNCGIHIHWEES